MEASFVIVFFFFILPIALRQMEEEKGLDSQSFIMELGAGIGMGYVIGHILIENGVFSFMEDTMMIMAYTFVIMLACLFQLLVLELINKALKKLFKYVAAKLNGRKNIETGRT